MEQYENAIEYATVKSYRDLPESVKKRIERLKKITDLQKRVAALLEK